MINQPQQVTDLKPKYKSVKLSPAEIVCLKDYVKTFHNMGLAADDIGIVRSTLSRIIGCGSGHSDNVELIRKKVGVCENSNALNVPMSQ